GLYIYNPICEKKAEFIDFVYDYKQAESIQVNLQISRMDVTQTLDLIKNLKLKHLTFDLFIENHTHEQRSRILNVYAKNIEIYTTNKKNDSSVSDFTVKNRASLDEINDNCTLVFKSVTPKK